jgi:ABC-type phosphate transport system permease subunit
VPSIVYGVFGLGFFCYSMGGYLDGGASGAGMARWVWWVIGGLVLALVAGAALLAARARPSIHSGGPRTGLKLAAGVVWILAAGGVVVLVARSPYFPGLNPEKLPSPTFGGPGLLWASLTLALLTLPVVIVSAEEALSAVPRSVREGSYGCGASQWQTLRRVVLPQALPGIMTGAILAMARGAGEVAPLMLVGAMKLAPELPVSLEPPFVHPERRFMHLGFHIYDLGFQSPDSEAARPLVWTTTLVLVLIVAALNLSAILIRNSLRARARGAVM